MGIRYEAEFDFFKKWSSDMAYVLGFWFADGSVEYSPQIRARYVRVGSTDKDVIYYIKRVLQAKHRVIKTLRPGHKTYYLLRIGNRELFDDLGALGVVVRKSNIIKFPQIPNQYFVDFIRGYFDGDGCVSLEKSKSGSYKRVVTVFTSGSKEFLEAIQSELHMRFGFTITKISFVKSHGEFGAFQLRYSTRNSLRLYLLLYADNQAFYLKRKFNVFRNYLIRNGIKDFEITLHLNTKGPLSSQIGKTNVL